MICIFAPANSVMLWCGTWWCNDMVTSYLFYPKLIKTPSILVTTCHLIKVILIPLRCCDPRWSFDAMFIHLKTPYYQLTIIKHISNVISEMKNRFLLICKRPCVLQIHITINVSFYFQKAITHSPIKREFWQL